MAAFEGLAIGSLRVFQAAEILACIHFQVVARCACSEQYLTFFLQATGRLMRGLEFLLIGGVAWTQFSDQALAYTQTALGSTDVTRERVYYELGLGINRILLFFRLDAVARLSQRQHPQFFFSLSTALF